MCLCSHKRIMLPNEKEGRSEQSLSPLERSSRSGFCSYIVRAAVSRKQADTVREKYACLHERDGKERRKYGYQSMRIKRGGERECVQQTCSNLIVKLKHAVSIRCHSLVRQMLPAGTCPSSSSLRSLHHRVRVQFRILISLTHPSRTKRIAI